MVLIDRSHTLDIDKPLCKLPAVRFGISLSHEPANVIDASIVLQRSGFGRVGAERLALLEAISTLGSIAAAGRHLGISYRTAWDSVQALNNLFDPPLILCRPGGREGGAARLSSAGKTMLVALRSINRELAALMQGLQRHFVDQGRSPDLDLFWSSGMKTSARNAFRGMITHITDGAVNAEVTLEIAEGVTLTAIITRPSVAHLGLQIGSSAIALIKSSFVMLAIGNNLRTSARNQLSGNVLLREDGAVNAEITVELAAGKNLVATITKESAEILDLKMGDPVVALIKAPHIILAVE